MASSYIKSTTHCLLLLCLFLQTPKLFAVNLTNEWQIATESYQKENYADSLAAYIEILKVDTNNVQALVGRASCHFKLKQFIEAFKDANQSIELSTNNFNLSLAYGVRGDFYCKNTNWYQAADDYSRSIQADPAGPTAYINRSIVFFNLGALERAMCDCNMAAMLVPELADVYDYRGRVFSRLKKYDKCVADYTRAIELSTNNCWYYYSRGRALANLDEYVPAIADLSKALELSQDNHELISEMLGSRGLLYSKIGNFDKGIADCKKAVETDTNCELALNNLAWLLATAPKAKLRDGKKAVDYAKRACELTDWQDAYCLGTLAAAYAEVGNFDEAVKWERKCILTGLPDKDIAQAHLELHLFGLKKPYHARK